MLSSRERRPSTAGNSNRNQVSSRQASSRQASSRPISSSRPASSRQAARPVITRQESTCRKSHEQLNDPILVNLKYSCDLRPVNKGYPPTIDPNHERYPTVCPNDNLKTRPRRPLTCPQAFVHANMNPTWEENPQYRPRVDGQMRREVSQHFIENNYEYMGEYRPEYRDKTPRAIRDEMVKDLAFCSTMRELKKKECSVKNGTSSHLIRSTIRHRGHDHNNRDTGTNFDPFIQSLHSSREQRVDKMTRLFMPQTKEMSHDKTFNRGYRHDSEFKNFSAFNGHLIRNKGTMLER
jgi:hypothetical protein